MDAERVLHGRVFAQMTSGTERERGPAHEAGVHGHDWISAHSFAAPEK